MDDADAILKNTLSGRQAQPAGISSEISIGYFSCMLTAKDGHDIPADIAVSKLMKRKKHESGYVIMARDRDSGS
jgi:hypothetical protein